MRQVIVMVSNANPITAGVETTATGRLLPYNEVRSQPNYPPISDFLKRELLQIRPVVGGYIAFRAMEM